MQSIFQRGDVGTVTSLILYYNRTYVHTYFMYYDDECVKYRVRATNCTCSVWAWEHDETLLRLRPSVSKQVSYLASLQLDIQDL